MRKCVTPLVAVIIGIVAGGYAGPRLSADDSPTRAVPSERNKAAIDQLRLEKLKVAEQRFQAVTAAFDAGNEPMSSVYSASIGWKDAAFEVAKSAKERREALEKHSERMSDLYKLVHTKFQNGRLGGEAQNDTTAHFWDIEGKIWALQE